MSWLKGLFPTNWRLIRRRPLRGVRQAAWIRGRYSLGPEVSSFQPNGGIERWWTSFSDTIATEANELMDSARGAGIDIELSGDVSEPGAYGHLGLYARTFFVRSIRR